ncbi:Zinc finger, C2CH-type [Cinara cedri]|uniref:Zinc finger, C2CH-type n=1 Tax=Cinara cedri TaxID=506608 RepID=A0A5E4MBY8_9HEMI|nr:Zinc finger, C2CH-type [Cinara cedri]
MTRKCSINNCKSFDGECTFFSVPKEFNTIWTNIIKNVNKCDTKVKFVCEKHFRPQDIVTTYSGVESLGIDFPKRIKPRLSKGAIPQIFNNDSHSSGEKESTKINIDESTQSIVECGRYMFPEHDYSLAMDNSYEVIYVPIESECLFSLKNIEKTTSLPKDWYSSIDVDALTFFYAKQETINEFFKVVIEKQIVITSDKQIRCYILDKLCSEEDLFLPKITSFSNIEIEKLIITFDIKRLCVGGPNELHYPGISVKHGIKYKNNIWRHNKCSFIIHELKRKRCSWCEKIIAAFRVQKYRRTLTNKHNQIGKTFITNQDNRKLLMLRKTIHNLHKSNSRYKIKIEKLQCQLNDLQSVKNKVLNAKTVQFAAIQNRDLKKKNNEFLI